MQVQKLCLEQAEQMDVSKPFLISAMMLRLFGSVSSGSFLALLSMFSIPFRIIFSNFPFLLLLNPSKNFSFLKAPR